MTTNLERIVAAAHSGQVATLFLADQAVQWGTFDVEAGRARLRSEPKLGDQDLLNLAALRTIANKGKVFTLPAADMPGNGSAASAAAILRY